MDADPIQSLLGASSMGRRTSRGSPAMSRIISSSATIAFGASLELAEKMAEGEPAILASRMSSARVRGRRKISRSSTSRPASRRRTSRQVLQADQW